MVKVVDALIGVSILMMLGILITLAAIRVDGMSFAVTMLMVVLTVCTFAMNKAGWYFKIIDSGAPVGK